MIKVGIVGADSPMAGELIRILVNHPDVDLVTAHAPSMRGRSVTSVHHGLTGECDLIFSDRIEPGKLDVIFIDTHSETAERLRLPSGTPDTVKGDEETEKSNEETGPKIIDMSHAPSLDFENLDMIYGLPELNRKPIVHGARRAVVPRSVAGVSVISLLPMATHLLLNAPISIKVECPDDIGVQEKLERALSEIKIVLGKIQNSLMTEVTLERVPSTHSARALRVEIKTESGVHRDELERIYEETFSDHNFTFISGRPMPPEEVEGTDKCIVSLSEHENGVLTIETVADCRMRGGAGDAVHIMNLMFGLHEKTGLSLKAHKY